MLRGALDVNTSRFGRRAATGANGYENLPMPTALSNDTKPPVSVPPDEYAHEVLATVDAATTQLRQRIIDAKNARSSRRPPDETVPLPAAVSLLTGWIPPILVRALRAK
jgi:hypothetical protein